MSGMKQLLFDEAPHHDIGGLTEIAAALGGEVDGRWVAAPSPDYPAEDRSLVVRIDPARPDSFFIYAHEGGWSRARDHVREKLKLVTPVVAPAADRIAAAMRIWNNTTTATGTLIEVYLRARGITMPVPTVLRYHGALRHGPTKDERPAMVALVTDVDDKPVAVHRTYLRRDGAAKATVEPNRMTLGAIRGAAVRLSPLADELAIGEGIETTLSAMQATGRPGWAALSTTGLKTLALPVTVRSVIILADGDDAGEAASRAAAARWLHEGRQVRIARAPAGKDFNDLLMEGAFT
jgi:hypothetical protein